MLLYCVRHGQSVHNAEGRIQGQTDSPLSELGRQQSLAVAEILRGLGIEALYSSPLGRAIQTAEPIARACALTIRAEPRLMELNAGVLQGRLRAELEATQPDLMRRWRTDPEFKIPGGESRRDLMRRGREAFEAIRSQGHQRVVVVAHGALLIGAVKALLGVPAEETPFEFVNAAVSQLQWDEAGAKLLALNDVRHLTTIGLGSRGDL